MKSKTLLIIGVIGVVLVALWLANAQGREEHVRPALPSTEEIAMLPPDGGPEFNRLIHEKSPYLLQHARNPVDWYPWGEEALARAKKDDKPIFLSVGYSTCHWCHVMERECFEREDVAKLLNADFIAIKVDREERPDLDQIYMNATNLMVGRGGWPNSLWLTPDGRPWYAGTYFPREDRAGRPGFKTILKHLSKTWRERRKDVLARADQVAKSLKQADGSQQAQGAGAFSRELVTKAIDSFRNYFDEEFAGFGRAQKFPPHGALRLILYEYPRTKDASLLKMATRTLDAMALGGIHDHIGGGFHRYSTDRRWFLPHFEKMLYDNAQLSRAYVDAWLITGNEEYRRVAEDIFGWVLREMTDRDGGFYSALDADSEGEEGKFYLWSRDEILKLLGKAEGELFCRAYGVEDDGNYREEATRKSTGTNLLFLPRPLGELAADEGIKPGELANRLRRDRRRLLKVRAERVWPHLDDKVLAGWNGLMIASLAHAGRHLGRPQYTAAAEKAANFILGTMRKDGRLLRSYRDGSARLNAYLNDYAFVADGLLELHEATGKRRWLNEAKALADVLIEHYRDENGGGFFFTSEDHEDLIARSKDPYDGAIPSGNGAAARVLLRLGRLTGDKRYSRHGKAVLEAFLSPMNRVPRGTQSLLLATAIYFDGIAADRPAADAHVRKPPVTLDAFASRLKVAPGQSIEIAVRIVIDDGWHINSHSPLRDYLAPTALSMNNSAIAAVGVTVYPEGKKKKLPFSPDPLSVYEGEVWITAEVKIADKAAGGPAELAFSIPVQACDDKMCLAPQTFDFAIRIEVDPAAAEGVIRHGPIFEKLGARAARKPGRRVVF